MCQNQLVSRQNRLVLTSATVATEIAETNPITNFLTTVTPIVLTTDDVSSQIKSTAMSAEGLVTTSRYIGPLSVIESVTPELKQPVSNKTENASAVNDQWGSSLADIFRPPELTELGYISTTVEASQSQIGQDSSTKANSPESPFAGLSSPITQTMASIDSTFETGGISYPTSATNAAPSDTFMTSHKTTSAHTGQPLSSVNVSTIRINTNVTPSASYDDSTLPNTSQRFPENTSITSKKPFDTPPPASRANSTNTTSPGISFSSVYHPFSSSTTTAASVSTSTHMESVISQTIIHQHDVFVPPSLDKLTYAIPMSMKFYQRFTAELADSKTQKYKKLSAEVEKKTRLCTRDEKVKGISTMADVKKPCQTFKDACLLPCTICQKADDRTEFMLCKNYCPSHQNTVCSVSYEDNSTVWQTSPCTCRATYVNIGGGCFKQNVIIAVAAGLCGVLILSLVMVIILLGRKRKKSQQAIVFSLASDELTTVSTNRIKQYAYDNRAYISIPGCNDAEGGHAINPDLAFSYRSYTPDYYDEDVDFAFSAGVSKRPKTAFDENYYEVGSQPQPNLNIKVEDNTDTLGQIRTNSDTESQIEEDPERWVTPVECPDSAADEEKEAGVGTRL
ncbi:hypothetical protein LSH36_4g06031 [Paralvinella palmiformis]|uniref:Uncharacterized protein n=1 Tax=Paralvinella palmiformis TaxID=53620 RepID=A0AAD9NHD2_9ANNE|nr:hypothetical protein LSH36_4g06031 [Paralvinella palmiformis]